MPAPTVQNKRNNVNFFEPPCGRAALWTFGGFSNSASCSLMCFYHTFSLSLMKSLLWDKADKADNRRCQRRSCACAPSQGCPPPCVPGSRSATPHSMPPHARMPGQPGARPLVRAAPRLYCRGSSRARGPWRHYTCGTLANLQSAGHGAHGGAAGCGGAAAGRCGLPCRPGLHAVNKEKERKKERGKTTALSLSSFFFFFFPLLPSSLF